MTPDNDFDRELERQQYVAKQLQVLRDAHGTSDKLEAAATLLGELGLIVNTPSAKAYWKAQ